MEKKTKGGGLTKTKFEYNLTKEEVIEKMAEILDGNHDIEIRKVRGGEYYHIFLVTKKKVHRTAAEKGSAM